MNEKITIFENYDDRVLIEKRCNIIVPLPDPNEFETASSEEFDSFE